MYRDINDFKKGYQPRTDILNDEDDDLVVDSHSILARWRSHLSDIEYAWGSWCQAEIHTAEPLVPQPSTFEGGGWVGY